MKQWIALLLVLCILFSLCACSAQPGDVNGSSSQQEVESLLEEEESSEEFDPDFMLDMQTLELIMPDGEENRIHQIDVADSTNFYLQEENGEESLYECHVDSETFYMIDVSTGTYFEGTYSVSENTITVSVTDYDYGVQPVDIAWQEKTYTITDGDGYVIQTDLKISPWIKEDNAELLNGAWDEISNGKDFPSLSRMGISKGELQKTYPLTVNWSEIVYAVGTFEAYNKTDGFDITASNSHSAYFILGGAQPEMIMYVAYGDQGELFYNVNNTGTAVFSKSGLLGVGAGMQSNHWGPVPFVIAYALEKTPNYPDGNPAPEDCVFAFGGTGGRFVSFDQKVVSEDEFHLDITW